MGELWNRFTVCFKTLFYCVFFVLRFCVFLIVLAPIIHPPPASSVFTEITLPTVAAVCSWSRSATVNVSDDECCYLVPPSVAPRLATARGATDSEFFWPCWERAGIWRRTPWPSWSTVPPFPPSLEPHWLTLLGLRAARGPGEKRKKKPSPALCVSLLPPAVPQLPLADLHSTPGGKSVRVIAVSFSLPPDAVWFLH